MTTDEYNIVINSPNTYKVIKSYLDTGAIAFAWTDEAGSQLDILMAYNVPVVGYLQRGMRGKDLFIAVSGFGMFGFSINYGDKHPAYVGEKLNLGSVNETTEKLAELINGVIGEINNEKL